MSDIILLSSDDETTTNHEIRITHDDNDSQASLQSDIDALIEKYKTSTYIKYKATPLETISSSSTSDEDEEDTLRKLREGLNRLSPPTIKDTININSEENIIFDEPKPKKTKNNDDKVKKQLEKARKQIEREQQKLENARAKEEKQKLALAYKNMKPEESLKFLTVLIDLELMSMDCSTDIPITLQNANVTYKVTSNVMPKTIQWLRKYQPQLLPVNGELQLDKFNNNCDEVLMILLWDEFIKLVHEHEFINHIQIKKELLGGKKLHLAIYGIENYYRFYKSRKQKITARERVYADAPKVARKDVDMALIEVQLMCDISHRFLETPQDLSAMILQFSKAISQIPFKLQKNSTTKEVDWYVSGDKKDSVKVDRSGNGLHRLWQQQLTQFNMVRLEVAQAIAAEYPSPAALIKAYEKCLPGQAERLLADIPIRRAAGPLTSARKIGPELSKKLYTLFTSLDGNVEL